MKFNLQAVLFASAFALLPLASSVPAQARPTVTFDFGNVAIGYRDGYRDQHQQYHRWAHKQDAVTYRTQHSENYRDMNHNRDHDHH
jgi:hypothetical protein